MKNVVLFTISFLCVAAFAKIHTFSPEFQAIYDEAIKPEVRRAQRKGAEAKIVYKVVDDEGSIVSNVVVNVKWENDYPRKTWYDSFCTDDNGSVEMSEKIGGRMSCGFHKDGYYSSFDKIDFHWRKGVSPVLANGKWQPYGEQRLIVLKRKKNPVDMRASHNLRITIPVTNVWIGMDLEKKMWVKPYGDGAYSDVLIRFNSSLANKYEVNWATMELSFTNNPYAGFYVLPKDKYSQMKSAYLVDTNKLFRQNIVYSIGRTSKEENLLGADEYIVFRTRTKVDEEGNLIQAHYGKIYGQWDIWSITKAQLIFFNTNPNDINIEDLDASTRVRLKQNGLLK